MGRILDITFEVVKSLGYFATGGICFYLLSGGKLPFQTMGSAISSSTSCSETNLERLERDYNAMTNNDKAKKALEKLEARDRAAIAVAEKRRADQVRTEEELARLLVDKTICGGMLTKLTPECLAKMREIEGKKGATGDGAK